MDMKSKFERWTLCRAQEIVAKEGFMLVDAAQALDKKRTRLGVQLLQQAISKALIEAQLEFGCPSAPQETDINYPMAAPKSERRPYS